MFLVNEWEKKMITDGTAAMLSPLLLYSYVRRVTIRRRAKFERAGVHQSLDERVHLQRDMRLTHMMLVCTWFQVRTRQSSFATARAAHLVRVFDRAQLVHECGIRW
jgi:hypothetical protein